MNVMIDPTNVRGALTGGSSSLAQGPQDQMVAQATTNQQLAPAAPVSTADALSSLEALVAESAQITPPVSPQPDPFEDQLPAIQQPQASQEPQLGLAPVVTEQPVTIPQDPSAQAVLTTMQNAQDPLNPPNPAPASAKESFERPAAPDATSIDAGGTVQAVEVEKNPELPVEVEGFLQRVEDFSAQPPQEVVIADGSNEQATTNYPSRPVIVLPITEDEEQKGKKKNPRNSIRWLVEWSHKVIKMFAGKVIYRHVEEE